ncbi:MAG: glutamate racemase [Clostridia bacterium]|nr:murI [Clostridiales bacterium]MDK2984546.1 glutamate racemase [Clostridia bacterium]
MFEHKPIGIFDSGVGGLSIVEEVFKQIPDADIIYFGDTAHVPYGPRPAEELIRFADEITHFLIREGAGVIIDACNSTSSVALDHLQEKYSNPIIGVIMPGIKSAIKLTKNGRIGVIGTETTIKSGSHAKNAAILDSDIKVFGQACPQFVPLVERGDVHSKRAYEAAEEYVTKLMEKNIDTLILGCTHYPYLRDVITAILGSEVKIVDPAIETVKEANLIFNSSGKPLQKKNKKEIYYVSGDPNSFRKVGSKLTGKLLPEVKKVIL